MQNNAQQTSAAAVGAATGQSAYDDEKLKIMMAMALLILKNIQYDDQGEDQIGGLPPTEVDCILRQLKSIMKQ